MFNLGKITTDLLNSIDNAAKETLEEPKESATTLRSKRRNLNQKEVYILTSLHPIFCAIIN